MKSFHKYHIVGELSDPICLLLQPTDNLKMQRFRDSVIYDDLNERSWDHAQRRNQHEHSHSNDFLSVIILHENHFDQE